MSAAWLFALLVQHAPPGQTAFSVEIATDCAPAAEACEGARFSPHYGAWVRRESVEAGRARYRVIAQALHLELREALCQEPDGTRIPDCTPAPGALDRKGRARWTYERLGVLAGAVGTLESGWREDVQVGRGSARKPSPDGGRGRGPGGEGCPMQIHPLSAWRFADHDPELLRRAEAGDRDAREAIVQSLLGTDQESLRRCFRVGLRMLIHARHVCSWKSPETEPIFATVSMYGTGRSCTDPNDGKTMLRLRLYGAIWTKAFPGTKAFPWANGLS